MTRKTSQSHGTDIQDGNSTYRVSLVNYADDDAGVNGGNAKTVQEAEMLLEQTNTGAESLNISLAVVGGGSVHQLCKESTTMLAKGPIPGLVAHSALIR